MSNDEGMDERLRQIDQAQASASATQSTLLADLDSRLEETNSLIQAATSETKALGSRFDLYAKSRIRFASSLISDYRDYFRNLGAEVLSIMRKIW